MENPKHRPSRRFAVGVFLVATFIWFGIPGAPAGASRLFQGVGYEPSWGIPVPAWTSMHDAYGWLILFGFITLAPFGSPILGALSAYMWWRLARKGRAWETRLKAAAWFVGVSALVFIYVATAVYGGFFAFNHTNWPPEYAGVAMMPPDFVAQSLCLPGKLIGVPLIEALKRGWGFGVIVAYCLLWGAILTGLGYLVRWAIVTYRGRGRGKQEPAEAG